MKRSVTTVIFRPKLIVKKIYIPLFSILIFLSCGEGFHFFENAICIENVNTIDAKTGLQNNQTIIIQEGKILKISPSDKLKLSPKNKIVDGSNKFLIPGLWDGHVHFSYIEELAPVMFDLFLAYGITSVRDTGGKIDFVKKWKDKALKDPKNAPRVMIAGPLLDGTPIIYNGSKPSSPALGVEINSIEEAEEYVNHLINMDVDLLKAYEMLTPEQFIAITKIAKEKGLKVTGHVPLSMDVISASNAGLNSMEHLRNLEMSISEDADVLLEKRKELLLAGKMDQGSVLRSRVHSAQRTHAIENGDDIQTKKVLNVLAKNQTWQIPTLSIMTASTERPFAKSEWRASFKYLPKTTGQGWTERSKKFLESEISEESQNYTNWSFNMVGKINEAEIGIMAGTDCPIFFLTPGLSLHGELELLVKSGLTPMEALEAATLRPAEYFNMEDKIGLIAEGMLADLILLEANPLDNISNTKKIDSVFKEGKLFSREDLDKIFQKLEEN